MSAHYVAAHRHRGDYLLHGRSIILSKCVPTEAVPRVGGLQLGQATCNCSLITLVKVMSIVGMSSELEQAPWHRTEATNLRSNEPGDAAQELHGRQTAMPAMRKVHVGPFYKCLSKACVGLTGTTVGVRIDRSPEKTNLITNRAFMQSLIHPAVIHDQNAVALAWHMLEMQRSRPSSIPGA